MWVYECVGVTVICLLVFTVFCIVCAVFFVLFRLCIFILICFVGTSVRTTATEWQLNWNDDDDDDDNDYDDDNDDDDDDDNNNNNNNNNNSGGNLPISISVNATHCVLRLYIFHLEPPRHASDSRIQVPLRRLVLHTPRRGKVSQPRFCDATTFSSSSP